MSVIRDIGNSLETYTSTLLSIPAAAVEMEPEGQFTERDASVEIYWEGDSNGTPDGDVALGGDINLFTGRFQMRLFRGDGDTDKLLDDVEKLTNGINFGWTAPGSLRYRQVSDRSIVRVIQENALRSELRAVDITVDITYREG